MKVIGIVGGIASGKSLVTESLRELGACVLDADRIGHEVLREGEVRTAVRNRWGDAVFDADGEVDRRAVARIVFTKSPAGKRELAFLEALVHPWIGQRLQEQIRELAEQGCPAVVLDAALMIKAGWDRYCDFVIFVDTPKEQRLERARTRGWSEEEFDAREDAQESLDRKRNRADLVIDNAGSPQRTVAQVQRLWDSHLNRSS